MIPGLVGHKGEGCGFFFAAASAGDATPIRRASPSSHSVFDARRDAVIAIPESLQEVTEPTIEELDA